MNLKGELKMMFPITDLGEPTKIVGIELTINPDSITIAQKQYILSILKSEGMQDANPVSTPLDPSTKLTSNPEGTNGDHSNTFAILIGKLQYLATAT